RPTISATTRGRSLSTSASCASLSPSSTIPGSSPRPTSTPRSPNSRAEPGARRYLLGGCPGARSGGRRRGCVERAVHLLERAPLGLGPGHPEADDPGEEPGGGVEQGRREDDDVRSRRV